MTPNMKSYLSFLILLHCGSFAFGNPADEDRMAWFHDAKFGMFIHWGIYSVPAGEWKGEKDHGEWIQYTGNIHSAEYEKFAAQFNPVKFNSDEWVSLAKESGMKYIVITSKHHDGFCMYDSKLTSYDIVDASPYRKDPMKDLSKSCQEHGLKFCFYYSVKDWHHPEYPQKYTRFKKIQPEGFHGSPNPNADINKYFDYMEGQVKELLSNYGPIGIMWFDLGVPFDDPENRPFGEHLVDVIHELQPNCLINNRLSGIGADYGTPEQRIPGGKSSQAFEVCMTLNRHWGYNKNDNDWKDAETVIHNLVDIVSKGGNYLLNVGPTSEGLIPQESIDILTEVGAWMKQNGESIYGTQPGGPSIRWNHDIARITTKDNKWYLHIFDWPEDNKIFFRKIPLKIKKAYLLSDKDQSVLQVKYYNDDVSVMIYLHENAPDAIDSVVVLEF